MNFDFNSVDFSPVDFNCFALHDFNFDFNSDFAALSQDFNNDFNADFGRLDTSKILKYNEVLKIDYMSVINWTRVADGVIYDIGVLLKIGRGDILLGYTPDLGGTPEDFIQNVYTSGNIFITTEHQVIWIKAVNPNFPITLSGEIIYNITPGVIVQPVEAKRMSM